MASSATTTAHVLADMSQKEEDEEESEFKREEELDEEDDPGDPGVKTGSTKELAAPPDVARSLVCSGHERCCCSQSRAT